MSFRLFVYYCALIGGWAAFIGWGLGRLFTPTDDLARAGLRGMSLGLTIALGLGLLDAVWSLGLGRIGTLIMRVSLAVLVGAIGGLVGGMVGQMLLGIHEIFFVIGWTLTGLLVGTSIGTFEFISSVMRRQDQKGALAKLIKSLVGGTIGGFFGGLAAYLLKKFSENDALWTPTALGFVILGMCIGLLVGLTQVILKEAWIKVEAGFKAGREMILSKESTVVGRAEGSDIALFGDSGVEKLHALIVLTGNRYYLEDSNTPGGTFVNDQRINGRQALKSGDSIRVGKSVLRFFEKAKR